MNNSKAAGAILALAKEKQKQGKYQEAILAFQKSIALKEDWDAYQSLGSTFFTTNQFIEAIEALQKSLTLKKDWNSFKGLGWAFLNTDQYQKAIEAFQKSIALKEDWNSYQGWGWALYKSIRFKESISPFQKSIALREDWNSYQGLGWALFRNNQFEEAVDAFQKSIALKEDWNTLYGLGWAQIRMNHFREAIEAFQKSIILKEDWSSYQGLGWALLNTKQYKEAIQNFDKSIEFIKDWNSLKGLGWALLKTKRYQEAIDAFHASLLMQPVWDSYEGLGWALIKIKQYKASINAFCNSIALNENNSSYLGLGWSLYKVNNQKQANDALKNSVPIRNTQRIYQGKEWLESVYQILGRSYSSLEMERNPFVSQVYEKYIHIDSNMDSCIKPDKTIKETNTSSFECSLIQGAVITNIYGVYNLQGLPFNESIITRGKKLHSRDFPLGSFHSLNLSNYPKFNEIRSAIWIKYLEFNHIGHALTEMCSSIYPLLMWVENGFNLNELTIVIPAKCKEHKETLATLLSLDPKQLIHVGDEDIPLRVNQLLIPRPTMVLRDFMHPNHCKVVQTYLKLYIKNIEKIDTDYVCNDYFSNKVGELPPQIHPSKLYISRSKMPSRLRKFVGEEEIERELIELGWTIIFPERTTVKNQLSLYKHAKYIAGTEGSAFHILMGIEKPKFKIILLTKVIRDPEEDMQVNLGLQFSSLNTKVDHINCLESTGNKWGTIRDVSLLRNYNATNIAKEIEAFSQKN
ncbi:tetratricopeptide repeat protein [Prochlorococcus sp. MIT 1300]|uniref:tetratricopeptide repeat protein n=1 Tax=Prochlorococcus sp. MIT 1300 TaxID=3096218 RepID=UPI002A756102|nr:tetratricopeptide repeat protein [Prochlorococcus sp. MIT 1300]